MKESCHVFSLYVKCFSMCEIVLIKFEHSYIYVSCLLIISGAKWVPIYIAESNQYFIG